jgi:hypothetical protein
MTASYRLRQRQAASTSDDRPRTHTMTTIHIRNSTITKITI